MRLRASDEAGETLIEVIIAIAIMGIAFVALLGTMLTATAMTTRHRSQAAGITQLVSAAEQVKRAAYDKTCTSTSPYALVVDAGWTAVGTVQYWNGASYQAKCYDTVGAGFMSQKVQVTVTNADGSVSFGETVVKRG